MHKLTPDATVPHEYADDVLSDSNRSGWGNEVRSLLLMILPEYRQAAVVESLAVQTRALRLLRCPSVGEAIREVTISHPYILLKSAPEREKRSERLVCARLVHPQTADFEKLRTLHEVLWTAANKFPGLTDITDILVATSDSTIPEYAGWARVSVECTAHYTPEGDPNE